MAAIFDLTFEALPVIFLLEIQRIWIQHPQIMLKPYLSKCLRNAFEIIKYASFSESCLIFWFDAHVTPWHQQ